MKNKTLFVAFIFAICTGIILQSCEGEPIESTREGDFNLELLFEKDGCKVYRFEDGSHNVYWCNCEGSVEEIHNENNGKYSHDVYVDSFTTKGE